MDIHGEDNCYFCDRNINWTAHIKEGRSGAFTFGGNTAIAEVIATGETSSVDGQQVDVNIIVSCPHCGNKNEYKRMMAKKPKC